MIIMLMEFSSGEDPVAMRADAPASRSILVGSRNLGNDPDLDVADQASRNAANREVLLRVEPQRLVELLVTHRGDARRTVAIFHITKIVENLKHDSFPFPPPHAVVRA
jgi:hypothetical protein